MPSSTYHARLSELPREYRAGGLYSRVGVVSDHANWSFIWLDSEFRWPEGLEHSHAHDQLMFVIEGGIRMTVGDREYAVEGGEVLYIPSGVPHSGEPLDDRDSFLMEAFAPIRTDYLYIAEHQLAQDAPERREDGSRIDTRSSEGFRQYAAKRPF